MSLALGAIAMPSLSTDPTGNPDVGQIFLYTVGSSLKIKLSNGNIFTFATGVTPEDVQDIVGSFIQPGSNKLSFVYDDTNNVLIANLVESNIVHQNLSGSGTNTHTQIDSHISNTSNPHATTASQVGADALGSSASAQAFAIQRTNHTGTQLANTISNFASSVVDTVLTGFAVGANAAIIATDSILAAFQKAQGQINAINDVLLSLVLGDQFENFEDNTTFTTTAATNQIAATFTTASKQTGKYRIAIEWDWTYSSATSDSIYSVFVDGVQVSQEFRYELSDTATQLMNNHFSYYATFATIQTHTIELRCRAETAGSTVTVSRVRAEIWRATP